ncbi:three-helix bundle dimerization domain-containing protein [Streptomyces sp. NPDC059979]
MDAELVHCSVQTAYEELRYARVRTCMPVLINRRAKELLPPDEQTERHN